MAKTEIDTIDGTPSKRIYRSIIADYDLNTSICELIDNSIDVDSTRQGGPQLKVVIDIDIEQQKITITDNAGGIKESDLKKLISPGTSSLNGSNPTIGIFGVGSKRSVVALSQSIKFSSRYHKNKTFRVEYDDEWLKDEETWELPYFSVDPISPSSTVIELSNLRFHIDSNMVDNLKSHLEITYSYFIENNIILIELNNSKISFKKFDQWAYPSGYEPTNFIKTIRLGSTGEKIKLDLVAGLTYERGSIGGDYGVFIYCNNRLICRALKSAEVGFISGIAGMPHPKLSFARVIVNLNGPSNCMPWESNKAGINYNHEKFQLIKKDIIEAVKRYTTLSKRLGPEYNEMIEPYKTGVINKIRLNKDENIKPSKLPSIPKGKTDLKTDLIDINKDIVNKKPWVRGLYEGVIAEDIIFKQKKLVQKNRISLIVLDSTLEIAFKDYLANELEPPMGDPKLLNILGNRIDVQKEVKKTILKGNNTIWKKINYYYKARCDLIHKRANVTISDHDIQEYRKVVKIMLQEMFKLKFPRD